MRKSFTTLLSSLAVTALCGSAAHAQTYQQVWADEFSGTAVNTANWKFETGGGGWGNNEKQYYQASNATVVNGELQITARKQAVGGMPYTSARMITNGLKSFTFGKMEARVKLPLGQGLWPAFWMLGTNIGAVGWPRCGEIDIMEQVNADSRTYGTAHWDNNGHAQYGQSIAMSANAYHVYSVEWTPTFIKWFMDGTLYNTMDITNGLGGTDEFQRSFFLLLNLAVAGDWPGQTVDESKLPATMFVDYVRVYQLGTTPPPAFSVTLQAESANVNNGMIVETCSEGGQDMGYIDAGDYLVWNGINFPTSGSYQIDYRIASGATGGTISSDLNAGSVQLGNTTIPGTGGWQTWQTVSKTVNVNAGTYNFAAYAQTGGYNLNWVRITKVAAKGALASANSSTRTLEIYPNPVTDRLTLSSGLALTGSSYRILNALGQRMAGGTLGSNNTLNVAALPAGIYTLEVATQDEQKVVRRFIK